MYYNRIILSVSRDGTDRNYENQINNYGGGTGGHIFPAVSIAKSIEDKIDNVEILFVEQIIEWK